MEVDDIEQNLLQQFSCMGTTDRDVLISQLRKLVGEDVNESTASFFLDMNNWNLQEAICSYFEFQATHKLPNMTLVKDVTIGEGESVPPTTNFIKTWRVSNSGDERWPEGSHLTYTGGTNLSTLTTVSVPALNPGDITDISVNMTSPSEPGMYESKWRMVTPSGSYFGDTIWVIISVDLGGTLALTQQLTHFNALGQVIPNASLSFNPFAAQSVGRTQHLQQDDSPTGS